MYVIDEQGNRVKSPDLESGYLEERARDVVHRYVVDEEERSHFEVVAEYPETGGRDLKLVVDGEERGHWETRLARTGELVSFEGSIPQDALHDQEVPDIETYLLYRRRTVEEADEMRRLEEEARRLSAFVAEGPGRLDAAEAAQADVDEAVCALYELLLEGGA